MNRYCLFSKKTYAQLILPQNRFPWRGTGKVKLDELNCEGRKLMHEVQSKAYWRRRRLPPLRPNGAQLRAYDLNQPCQQFKWEETGVPGENPRLLAERWLTLQSSHMSVVSPNHRNYRYRMRTSSRIMSPLFLKRSQACPFKSAILNLMRSENMWERLWKKERLRIHWVRIPCLRSLRRVKMPFEIHHFVETIFLLKKDRSTHSMSIISDESTIAPPKQMAQINLLCPLICHFWTISVQWRSQPADLVLLCKFSRVHWLWKQWISKEMNNDNDLKLA